MPGRFFGGRVLDHVIDGFLIFFPFIPVAPVFISDLPVLGRGVLPGFKPFQLGLPIDVDEKFQDDGAVIGKDLLKVVDLRESSFPFFVGGDAFDSLHHDPAIPAAVPDADVTGPGDLAGKAPEVMAADLLVIGCRGGVDGVMGGVQVGDDPVDGAALAGSIPAFKDQHQGDAVDVESMLDLAHLVLEDLQPVGVILVADVLGQVGLA